MKHSLKYYLDEGFMKIYYWPTENGGIAASFRYTKHMPERIRRLDAVNGGDVLVVDDVAHLCDGNFFQTYGIMCAGKDEAEQGLVEYMNELKRYHDIFYNEIMKQIETV
jgi:hypothetical protein